MSDKHPWHTKHERKHASKNIKHKGPNCAYDRIYSLSHIGPGDTAWVNDGPVPVTEGCGWGCPDCMFVCGGPLQFVGASQ